MAARRMAARRMAAYKKKEKKDEGRKAHGRMIYELIACYYIPYDIRLSYNINQ